MRSYNTIPWWEVYGLRNRIVHDYEGVNLKFVWEIIIISNYCIIHAHII